MATGQKAGGLARVRQRISDWIFRPRTPEAPPVTLVQRRIFILPTQAGVGYAVVLLLLLLASINYTLSLGYLLTFFLAAMGWVTLHATHRNLSRLQLWPGRCDPVFAGEVVHYRLRVESPARRRYALALRFSSHATKGGDAYTDAAPDRPGWIELQRATHQRGRLASGRLEVYTRYPLGLFHAWSYFDFGQAALVYPRPNPAAGPLPTSAGEAADEGTIAPGGDEFAGLRDYRPGDNLRKIAWKALARGQGLLTKDFHGYQSGDLWLDWREAPGGNFEARLSALCQWVLQADRQALRYGLRLPGAQIGPDVGDLHRERCLEALALA
jgi:uncharacterized protein (DUF58 family)